MTFDLAAALKKKGYDLHYAELHFVIGVWTDKPEDSATMSYQLRMPGRAALVSCLPVVRTAARAAGEGVPVMAVLVDAAGQYVKASDGAMVHVRVDGNRLELREENGVWRTTVKGLKAGDHRLELISHSPEKTTTQLMVRVTGGDFYQLNPDHSRYVRNGRVKGPLSGSYFGNVFVRDAGKPAEALVQSQKAWDDWDRSQPPGEHLCYWEALTPAEMAQRFAYLQSCGWDLLHPCQHWGIWERLDAGGRISPHGAEQVALYYRAAGKHDLAVIQALTHYEYATQVIDWHGTVPFTRYLDAGFAGKDFLEPGRNPKFEELFHRYLLDYVNLFRDETALFAMTASGEGDATIGHARAHDGIAFVRGQDRNHLFLGEPTLLLYNTPRTYTRGWRQDLFGGRTYNIGNDLLPEFDLGVEMKLYQLGHLAMAEGSWGTSHLHASFRHQVLKAGDSASGSWTSTERYRLRLRDSLYLGLVHRLPMMMTWDEQIAEDEHRLIHESRELVDWTRAFQAPRLAIRLKDDDLGKERRQRLFDYEIALNRLRLSYCYIHHDDPIPSGVEVVIEAAKPFQAPAFVADGGMLPDSLKSTIPLAVSPGYAVSY